MSNSLEDNLSNKFQCLNPDDDDMDEDLRVYSINEIIPDPYIEHWKFSPSAVKDTRCMDMIAAQFKRQDSLDISLRIHGGNGIDEIFQVNTMILQCYSMFFQKRSCHEKEIKLLPGRITPNVFHKIYEWMMSTPKFVERDGLIPLLQGAQYLKVSLMEQQIWNLIQNGKKFQENEAFLLYLEAKQWRCEKVQHMMSARVQRFFLTVVSSEDFFLMDADEIMNWLKLDGIGINLEVEVFYCAARWLLFDWDNRNQHLLDLMKLVRFGLIEPWRIVECRMNKAMGKLTQLLTNAQLQQMLEKSLSYATYLNCFRDDTSDPFIDFLNRFGFKRLHPRDTMIDPVWQMRYKYKPYSYSDFENYLNHIQSNAQLHWKDNVIIAK